MPQINNIVINDAASTPLAHTMSPVRVLVDQNKFSKAEYANRAPGIAIGFEQLEIGLRAPVAPQNGTSSVATRQYKAVVGLRLPILEVTSPNTGTGIQPAPTVAYYMEAQVSFMMPERSTLQNRKDLRKLAVEALSNAATIAVVENLETIY